MYSLSKNVIYKLDDERQIWGKTVPSAMFYRRLRALSQFKNLKAADHKSFSVVLSHFVFDGNLPSQAIL